MTKDKTINSRKGWRLLLTVTVVAVLCILSWFYIVKPRTDKGYVFFVVNTEYQQKGHEGLFTRVYITNIVETKLSDYDLTEKLRTDALFQAREKINTRSDIEYVKQTYAWSVRVFESYDAAYTELYKTLQHCEDLYGKVGHSYGAFETFNLNPVAQK